MGTTTARQGLYRPSVGETGWGTLVDANFTALDQTYNVEGPAWGAVADSYFEDGVATASSTTFTSATANFTAADVGKHITILRASSSSAQPHSTTIASFTNSTTVVLTNSCGRSQTPARFYLARGGDQTTEIQNAINAAAAAGGGIVYCPGVGYSITGLTLKNRVSLIGAGHGATMLRLAPGSNRPILATEYSQVTTNASAGVIANIKLLGNRNFQTNPTTTLTGNYTAGGGTMTVTDATNFLQYGVIQLGTYPNHTRYRYTKSGNTLTLLQRGVENTTDANYSIGATVTQFPCHGIWLYRDPPTTGVATDDLYDTHWRIFNVSILDVKGDGVQQYGQAELMMDNCSIEYASDAGVRCSFDSNISNVSVGNIGRVGFIAATKDAVVGCNAYFCGSVDPSVGWGFMFEAPPPVSDVEGTPCFSSCRAQDNQADGWMLNGADRVGMAACSASSNGKNAIGDFTVTIASPAVFTKSTGGKGQSLGHGFRSGDRLKFRTTGGLPTGLTVGTYYYVITTGLTATQFQVSTTLGGAAVNTSGSQSGVHSLDGGTYVGVRLMGTQNSTIDCTCTERKDDGVNSTQLSAVSFDGIQCAGNQLRIQHGGTTGIVMGPAVLPSSDLTGGNALYVNGQGSTITAAFATTYTPDPYVATTHKVGLLTNNITIAAPTNAHMGAELRIILTQDGTGGRTVTWNGTYVFNPAYANTGNTLDKKFIADFVYDGTNWQCVNHSQSATAGTYWA